MSHKSRNFVVAYALLVGLPLLGLGAVLRTGRTTQAPTAIGGVFKLESGVGHVLMPDLFILILQIAVVLSVCRIVGAIFQKIGQPRVVGEMFAGIMLGPSLLGWLSPHSSSYLFPPSSLGFLNALSQIGVLVFMFVVGLGINPRELKKQGHAAVLTSHVGISAPFVLASLLSLYLYPRLSIVNNNDSVTFTSFTLFMGAAMSITAFPVLARILQERNLLGSRLGTVAIGCAAVGDATGWCILAYIVVLIRAAHSTGSIWVTIGGIAVFGLIMIYGVRPLLRGCERVYKSTGALSENLIALMLLLVLISALCTELLGIHALFGAFLMGAIMPKQRHFVRYVLDRFETITVTLLLPLFFAFTGLRTNIGLVKGSEMWMYCGLIILVATAGKLGGTTLAAWFTGIPLREAAGLGTLMNTRGLMELVILNIGLDIGVISPALFSMMVIMALVTTFMTTPVLGLICPKEFLAIEPEKVVAQSSPMPIDVPEGQSQVA
ncbi:MAG TPA: cation:proton antiporter [Candidatus Sulfotelmatobacter sp.]|jgi:Kef-type K+ transport system membrane component KefB